MATVTIRPWAADDLDLLVRGNAATMTEHLGGPETDDEVRARHTRYLRFWREGSARMFAIEADGEPVGGIGWWTTQWNGEDVHETGWFVIPGAQGRGIARAAATLVIDDAVQYGTQRLLTACPSVDNVASNLLCERSGFTRGEIESFAFRGTTLTVTMWMLDLDELRRGDSRRRNKR
jgi:RimJ/RimL family protein N-acetyltransferase